MTGPTIRYKLTTQAGTTYGDCQWGENVTHETDGSGKLCGPGWLHVYTHPLLAVLLNPIHVGFDDPVLWLCHVGGKSKTDRGLKEGWTSVTTVRRLELPTVTVDQRVEFAIRCAKHVCHDPSFTRWADRWLSGADRTRGVAWEEARAAAEAAAWAAERAAEAAAWAAAEAAAWAAEMAAAEAAAKAAEAAAKARDTTIDLISIAEQVCGKREDTE